MGGVIEPTRRAVRRRSSMAEPSPSAMVPSAGSAVRLGSVEAAILAEIHRGGGVAARHGLVNRVIRDAAVRGGAGDTGTRTRARAPLSLAHAESAVSRAIASLARKGLLVVERNRPRGGTLIRAPNLRDLPSWEKAARQEEELAAECEHGAGALSRLAARARRRAAVIRSTRSQAKVRVERATDVQARDLISGRRE